MNACEWKSRHGVICRYAGKTCLSALCPNVAISIVYSLSLCCPVWQTVSLYVVIVVCPGSINYMALWLIFVIPELADICRCVERYRPLARCIVVLCNNDSSRRSLACLLYHFALLAFMIIFNEWLPVCIGQPIPEAFKIKVGKYCGIAASPLEATRL